MILGPLKHEAIGKLSYTHNSPDQHRIVTRQTTGSESICVAMLFDHGTHWHSTLMPDMSSRAYN